MGSSLPLFGGENITRVDCTRKPEPESEPESLRIAFADAHPLMYEAWKDRLPRTALEKLESHRAHPEVCSICEANGVKLEPPDLEDTERR